MMVVVSQSLNTLVCFSYVWVLLRSQQLVAPVVFVFILIMLDRSCVSVEPLSTISLLYIITVLTAWYFYFSFHFYYIYVSTIIRRTECQSVSNNHKRRMVTNFIKK